MSTIRPILVTIICIIGFLGGLLFAIGVSLPSLRVALLSEFGRSSLLVLGFIWILSLVGLAGYWQMRKWGLYVYASGTVIGMVHGASFSFASIVGFLVPILVIVVGVLYSKRMT